MATRLLTWMERAACRGLDTNWWFPTSGDYSLAEPVCSRCPVAEPCLAYALAQPVDNFGMFGGTTPQQREMMRWESRRL